MQERTVTVGAQALEEAAQRLLAAAGASPENAAITAGALVRANLAGHDSHGVIRIPQYLAGIRAGELFPAAEPVVAKEAPSGILVNGNWTFGQVSCAFALRVGIERARERGLAAVGVVRCHHSGRLGEYAEMAADAGMIALTLGGGLTGIPLAAPFGGRRAALGANPLAAGLPAAGAQGPFIMDIATTVVAEGKLRVARDRGVPLEPGAIVDKDGRPSTDPNDFYAGGMLLPFGGHKGYALSLAAELLTTALLGPADWAEEGRGGAAFGHSAVLFLVIDPSLFGDRDAYLQRASQVLAAMKDVPPAPGFTEVAVPGDPERHSAAVRRVRGIPLPEATWSALTAAATSLGVTLNPPA